MKRNLDPKDEKILAHIEREENEYRNHPVWRQMRCTPEQFNAAVKKFLVVNNIRTADFNRLLEKQMQKIATIVREQKRDYKSTNLRILSGMRA